MRPHVLALVFLLGGSAACGTRASGREQAALRPASSALAAACQPGRLGYESPAPALAAGVVADPRPQELVRSESGRWSAPQGVTFTLTGAPRVEAQRVVLRGELRNDTAAPQTVMLTEGGGGFFYATIARQESSRRVVAAPTEGAPPPVALPEPHAWTLAPGARWSFETAVLLGCWELPPQSRVSVHWWFGLTNANVQGELAVQL